MTNLNDNFTRKQRKMLHYYDTILSPKTSLMKKIDWNGANRNKDYRKSKQAINDVSL